MRQVAQSLAIACRPVDIKVTMADLFTSTASRDTGPRPLADRLRPAALADVIGQSQVLGRAIFWSSKALCWLVVMCVLGIPLTG